MLEERGRRGQKELKETAKLQEQRAKEDNGMAKRKQRGRKRAKIQSKDRDNRDIQRAKRAEKDQRAQKLRKAKTGRKIVETQGEEGKE